MSIEVRLNEGGDITIEALDGFKLVAAERSVKLYHGSTVVYDWTPDVIGTLWPSRSPSSA